MNTYETYVSLETAKLLKQAGFDWETVQAYGQDEGLYGSIGISWDFNNKKEGFVSAPTLDVAQRWLREVKEMYAEAYLSESHHTPVWIAEVYLWENRPLGRELRDKCLCTGIGPVYFDTYEEALEAGINKCLTLLLKEE